MAASLPWMGVVVRVSLLLAVFYLASTTAFTSSLAAVRTLKHGGSFLAAEPRMQSQRRDVIMTAETRSRREVLWAFGGIATGILAHFPAPASAEETAVQVPQISLQKFYEELALQEVESVEFDGPKFEVSALLSISPEP
eukprot:3938343-Rhodomonas_salina.2